MRSCSPCDSVPMRLDNTWSKTSAAHCRGSGRSPKTLLASLVGALWTKVLEGGWLGVADGVGAGVGGGPAAELERVATSTRRSVPTMADRTGQRFGDLM